MNHKKASRTRPTSQRTSNFLIAVVLVLCLYISSYYAIVEAAPSGILRIGPGPWPKDAVYPIGEEVIDFGGSGGYPLDSLTQPLFTPINGIDRQLRPSHWNY